MLIENFLPSSQEWNWSNLSTASLKDPQMAMEDTKMVTNYDDDSNKDDDDPKDEEADDEQQVNLEEPSNNPSNDIIVVEVLKRIYRYLLCTI